MKFESNHTPLLERTLDAFNLAVADTLEEARRVAPVRTGYYRDTLATGPVAVDGSRISARLGSPLVSARAKERGAYIEARRDPYLAIPTRQDGSMRKVKAVRLPARPVVSKAGPKFIGFMTERLREQSR